MQAILQKEGVINEPNSSLFDLRFENLMSEHVKLADLE